MISDSFRTFLVVVIIVTSHCSVTAVRRKYGRDGKGGKGGKGAYGPRGGKGNPWHEVTLGATDVHDYTLTDEPYEGDDAYGWAEGYFTFYYRNNYLKNGRCSGRASDTCESCFVDLGGVNCVKPVSKYGDWLELEVAGNQYQRFHTQFEVKCPEQSQNLNYQIYVETSYPDNWAVYQNGQFVKMTEEKVAKPDSGFDKLFAWKIDLSDDSHGSEIMIEFTAPDSLGAGQIAAGRIAAWMDFSTAEQYLECEDNKVCLSELPRTTAGRRLRYENTLQKKCLDGFWFGDESMRSACNKWGNCLQRTETKKSMKMLLHAGHAGTADRTGCVDALGCIHPRYTDPEGWECNCMEEWKTKCEDIKHKDDADCLTAAFCLSPTVCQCWKDSACHNSKISHIQQKLKRPSLVQVDNVSESLMQSDAVSVRASKIAAQERTLDSSMGSKSCV